MATENKRIIDKETGEIVFKSRSIAVVACLVTLNPDTKEYNFLVERRGPGCPDHVGELAFPCGYLNWDETRKDAVIREVFEELGLELNIDTISEWKTIDDPNHDEHQNVVTRYIIPLDFDQISEWIKNADFNSEARGGEKDEVSEVCLIPYSEIEANEEKWAFNHKEVIEELVSVLNIYIDEEGISDIVEEEPEEEEKDTVDDTLGKTTESETEDRIPAAKPLEES